jgi:predicted transcriptional regulator
MSHGAEQFAEALKRDREVMYLASINWYRETFEMIKAGEITWDDLSDVERGLFRVVERHEARKLPRKARST